jgi:transcriptional regulator with GAF, ATPase, and Fis domain
LNASMHIRALLTDLFLLNDIVTTLKALRRAEGRIYGAGGAAELLGLKPTTLTSRLRALKIDIPSR